MKDMEMFKTLYDIMTKASKIDILRPVDIESIKPYLLELDIFKGVLSFDVIDKPHGLKVTLFRPSIDSFNRVVEIYSIQMVLNVSSKHMDDEYNLMIMCKEGTVIRNED